MNDKNDLDYATVLNNSYNLAEKEGMDFPEKAWLYLEDAYWWPNPYYKGEPVPNPDNPTGTETNPPTTKSLKERNAKRAMRGGL